MLAKSLLISAAASTVGMIQLRSEPPTGDPCDFSVDADSFFAVIDYDVFSFERAAATVKLPLTNNGDIPCLITLEVLDLNEAPPPFLLPEAGTSIRVNLPSQVSNGQALSLNEPARISLPGRATTETAIDFFTPQQIVVPAGFYEYDLRINVRLQGSPDIIAQLLGEVVLNATPRAQVNIAGADGAFDENNFADRIEFRDPKEGDERQVFIQTRSNALTSLKLTSQNGARMNHVEVDNSYIGYDAFLGGQEIDLSSDVIIGNRPATDLRGVSTPLRIVIADSNLRYAGEYKDLITVEITAQ